MLLVVRHKYNRDHTIYGMLKVLSLIQSNSLLRMGIRNLSNCFLKSFCTPFNGDSESEENG